MKALYRIEHRKVKLATLISVVCMRGNVEVRSSEKVLPPILEYDEDGNYTYIGPMDILQGLHTHPYKANSKDFNRERLADLEVATMFKQLEHFPTLPIVYTQEGTEVHPIAELLYSNIIYLKPSPGLAGKLEKMDYVGRTKVLPIILEKVGNNFEKDKNLKMDLFSVPKRKVGTFAYLADKDGISKVAKLFSFGFHNAIPCDRIARELSSLKACEKFSNPAPINYPLPEVIKPYVSTLRVAIIGTEHSMLDSGDLFKSSLDKIACRLSRKKVVKDVHVIPVEERNLVFRPFRSGIEIFHEQEDYVNEEETNPGTIRLIFPGGVKVAAQWSANQAYDAHGKEVDAFIGFETFAKKGAICCLTMNQRDKLPEFPTVEDCVEVFRDMKQEKITLNGTEYEGYIVELPVMRPGQRYTELSKSSDQITVDFIAKAILQKDYRVRPHVEDEYQRLLCLRHAINLEIESIK